MFRMLFLLFALSCTWLVAGEPRPEKKVPGFTSPQEAWEAYRHARHEGRWREAFRCLTPKCQEEFVGGIVFAGAYLQGTEAKDTAKKLTAVLKSHGLDLSQIEAETRDLPENKAADYEKELNRRVKDKEGLFDEAMILVAQIRPQPKDKDGKPAIACGKLVKVKIAGDRATGECVRRVPPEESYIIGGVAQTQTTQEIEFRKIDGRWFVDSRGD